MPDGIPDIGQDGIKESAFEYTLILYSNKAVQVSCSTSIGSAESAASSGYFPNTTNGAESGGCSTSTDYPPFGLQAHEQVGYWYYEIGATGPQLTYNDSDPGHPLDGEVIAFEENDCNAYRMSVEGDWTDTTLAEVFEE